MAKRTKDPVREEFNEITQYMPKGKCRFDPVVQPELLVWFLMHIQRFEELRDANSQLFQRTGMVQAAEIATMCESQMKLLEQCITWSAATWPAKSWESTIKMLKDQQDAAAAADKKIVDEKMGLSKAKPE